MFSGDNFLVFNFLLLFDTNLKSAELISLSFSCFARGSCSLWLICTFLSRIWK